MSFQVVQIHFFFLQVDSTGATSEYPATDLHVIE